MVCAVCAKELGLWAKLSGQSGLGVCKTCHEQGHNRLETLARAAGNTQNWDQQYARGWLSQFEEIAQKFHTSAEEATPLRFELLNNIFKLIESKDEMPDSDLTFIGNLAKQYSLSPSWPDEIKDTIFRIGTREAIQKWEHGEPPITHCNGLVLQKNEKCHWEEGAGLKLQHVKRHYEGGFASVSVPVHLMKGMRIRVGGFKGYPVDETVLENGGVGVIHITNQRVCFAGADRAVTIPYKKMISIQGFETGFTIQTTNEKKPGIFIVRHPELTVQLVNLASSGAVEEEPPKTRRAKLSSAV
jgi:hypothetical protein